MDLFAKFKDTLKKSVAALKRKEDPARELMKAIEASDNWDTLEKRLIELRAVSRKRQQEVLVRLEPLAKQVESLIAQAKEAKVKVVRQNLLRQADGYMQQLEAEDEPAKIHSANCAMLTNIVKQVQRARAMGEGRVEADAIDLITTHLEEIVVSHEAAMEAAAELESAGRIEGPKEVSTASLEKRLSSIYEVEETPVRGAAAQDVEKDISDIEKKLYE